MTYTNTKIDTLIQNAHSDEYKYVAANDHSLIKDYQAVRENEIDKMIIDYQNKYNFERIAERFDRYDISEAYMMTNSLSTSLLESIQDEGWNIVRPAIVNLNNSELDVFLIRQKDAPESNVYYNEDLEKLFNKMITEGYRDLKIGEDYLAWRYQDTVKDGNDRLTLNLISNFEIYFNLLREYGVKEFYQTGDSLSANFIKAALKHGLEIKEVVDTKENDCVTTAFLIKF